jgi:hypothetical protein
MVNLKFICVRQTYGDMYNLEPLEHKCYVIVCNDALWLMQAGYCSDFANIYGHSTW